MKFLILSALTLGMMSAISVQAAPKIYSTSINGVETYGDSPYTDPNWTKLEDGNLGTLNSLTSADVEYTTTTYPLSAQFLFVPMLKGITVYAYKDTAAHINIPTSIHVNCNLGDGQFYNQTFTFNPASYPNNERATLTLNTGAVTTDCGMGTLTITNTGNYTVLSEVVWQ